MAKNHYWIGEVADSCQLCGSSFGDTMYDAAIKLGGPWANICRSCFSERRCNLGVGRGQEYHLQNNCRWLKVAG